MSEYTVISTLPGIMTDQFAWQEDLIHFVDQQRGPFHVVVTIPRRFGGSTLAMNLERRRNWIRTTTELSKYSLKFVERLRTYDHDQGFVVDLLPEILHTAKIKYDGLVVEVHSPANRLPSATFDGHKKCRVIEIISDENAKDVVISYK